MKTRVIHTKFWSDNYISELPYKFKLLFNYFITNELIGLTGIYEISRRRMALDTGLDLEDINLALENFAQAKKIFYIEGFIILINHKRYQNYSTGNPNQRKAYDHELEMLPVSVKNFIKDGTFQLVEDQSPTNLEVVGNELPSSSQLDINKKTKIKKHKSKNAKDLTSQKVVPDQLPTSQKPVENKTVTASLLDELDDIRIHYNTTYKRDLKTAEPLLEGFVYWRQHYTCDDIKLAITTARKDRKFGADLDFQIFFKQTNKQGDRVDFIGAFLARAEKDPNRKAQSEAERAKWVAENTPKVELSQERKLQHEARLNAWKVLKEEKDKTKLNSGK